MELWLATPPLAEAATLIKAAEAGRAARSTMNAKKPKLFFIKPSKEQKLILMSYKIPRAIGAARKSTAVLFILFSGWAGEVGQEPS
ncbi:MAG: hypothetical protein ACK5ZJ_11550 [Acidobacteriota bacterium]